MKSLVIYLLFLLAGVFFCSCSSEPPLHFEQPQPLAISSEKEISAAIWGTYISTRDSSLLKVSARELVRFNFSTLDLALDQLQQDSVPYHIRNGYFYTPETKKGYPVLRQTADSIFLAYHFADTLFTARNQNQVKKFKGRLVFNTWKEENLWEVFCLAPGKKKSLQLRTLSDSLDVAKLNTLKVLQKRKDLLVANPSKKDFRKFLRDGGFTETETFLRYRGPLLQLETELFTLTSNLTPGDKLPLEF